MIPIIAPLLPLIHLLLPPLVLLDTPLPRLFALHILSIRLGLFFQAERLGEFLLLFQPRDFFCGDLALLVVCDEVFAVRGG